MLKQPQSLPIIGITLDSEEEGAYSAYPYYALRKHYAAAVAKAGAIAIHLPQEHSQIDHYLALCDAFVFTGGDVDVHPSFYGQQSMHDKANINSQRTDFEMALMRKVIDQKIPMLAICAGEQLMNVLLGGDMIQHIPDEVNQAVDHEVKNPHLPAHSIQIVEGTQLHDILGVSQLEVNSTHHQAVRSVGENVLVSATAPDGVIEAIEYTEHPFCIGIEWHPEFLNQPEESRLFEVLVSYARR